MAYSTGTATSHIDFLSKLRTFALTQNFEDVFWDSTTWVAKGKGLQGYDEVYLELTLYENSGTGAYNLQIRGAAGCRNDAESLKAAPVRGGLGCVALWNNPMDYWFIVNGRRIIIVAKVGSKYAVGYLGLLLPLGTDQQYPYPLLVKGTHYDPELPHSDAAHKSPWYPDEEMYKSGTVWAPGGRVHGYYQPTLNTTYNEGNNAYFKIQAFPWDAGGYKVDRVENWGGGFIIEPGLVYLYRYYFSSGYHYSKEVMAQFDGIYFIGGIGQASENIVEIGGDSYLVVQSFAATDNNAFAAIKLS